MGESTRADVPAQSERYVVNAPVEKIEVPENRLRELRDFSGLAASMERLGLLQPITCTEGGVLVAGRHRLEAARSLGWKTIPSFVVEDDELENRLQEIDENLRRLDLTVYEQAKHADERERVLVALGERRGPGGDPATVAGWDQRATAEVAAEAGMSERSWQGRVKIGRGLGEQTKAVLDHADPTDEKHRNFLNSTTQLDHIVNVGNKHGDEEAAELAQKVLAGEYKSTFDGYEAQKRERDKAALEEKRAAHRAALQDAPAHERKYEVLYADPPWLYEHAKTESRRIENQYPTMSAEELAALEVPASEDCVLFMWATSPKLSEAFDLMAAWGFSYRTCMVWVKDRIGMGYYARQRHELLLIGVKGEPGVPEPSDRPDSVMESPRGRHSAKPEAGYEVVERMYPGRVRVELFARTSRPGWDAWGNEVAA